MDAAELLSLQGGYLSRYLLALVRVLGALSFNPLFGSSRVPVQARIGLALLVTLVLFPPGGPAARAVGIGPLELLGELLVGLLAGFAVALAFAGIQFGAALLGVGSGLNLAGTLDPHTDLGEGALDRFFSVFAILAFLQINGHHLFLQGLRELFQAVDVGMVPLLPTTPDALSLISGAVFSAAVRMVLPVLAALLLADLGLAVLSRVAPQLNLFALGLPLKIAIGLGLLGAALPWIVPHMFALFRALPESMLALAR